MPIFTTLGAACAKAWGFTSGLITDQYFNLVSLLLPGNGTNGAQNNTFQDSSPNTFPITRNPTSGPNAPTQGTFSPFSQTGWGNYFDGTSGQYLNTPSNAAFSVGTGNFTLEAWVYVTGTNFCEIFTTAFGSTPTTAFRLLITNAQKLQYSDGTNFVISTGSVALNTWVHVCVVREGTGANQTKLYINGNQDGATTSSNNLTNTTGYIGRTWDGIIFTGYISNLRLVKGVAVYTGNFTPPITPLAATQSAGTNISAITGTQTSLLTCQSNRFIDNSVANSGTGFAITVNGSPRVTPFSPFAPTQSYSAAAVGGSGYFDGTGDYLSAPSSTNLLLNGVDSTIEGWYYLNASPGTPGTSTPFFCQGNTGSGTSGNSNFWCFADATTLYFGGGGDSSYLSTSVSVVPIKQWFHLAVVITAGTSANVYINGSSVVSGSGMVAVGSTTSRTTLVGYMMSGSSVVSNLNGYCSGFRIVKGTAITPPSGGPTSPPTAVSGTSLLLNFTNAGVVDATAKNVLETVGNAQISTSVSKFGGGSMRFPQSGTNDYLLMPVNDLTNFGNGAFTVEGWVRINVTGSFQAIYSRTLASVSGYGGTWVRVTDTNVLQAVFSSGTSAHDINISGTTALTTGQWYHFAWVRSSNTFSLYLNGNREGTNTSSVTMYASGDRVSVGTQFNVSSAASFLNGYVDDLRVTKGLARYDPTQTSITIPTAPFPLQ